MIKTMKQDGFAAILVLIIVLAVAILGGAAYVRYVYLPHQAAQLTSSSSTCFGCNDIVLTSSTFTSTQHVSSTATDSIGTVSIQTDVKTTVSCGSQDCFNKNFFSCTPASLKADSPGLGGVSYNILGPTTGGCKMTFEYTSNPNPTWVNQPMTCTFNNAIDFQTSIQNTFNAAIKGRSDCTGPLAIILKDLSKPGY